MDSGVNPRLRRAAMETSLKAMKFDQGLNAVMNAVRAGNRYLEKTAPWALAKKGEVARLQAARLRRGEVQPDQCTRT